MKFKSENIICVLSFVLYNILIFKQIMSILGYYALRVRSTHCVVFILEVRNMVNCMQFVLN